MKFALLITASASNSEAPATALRFATAALKNGHSIYRVFFFRDGVHNANTYTIAQQDEHNIPDAWQQFCHTHNLDAATCVSAALKRGVVDEKESQRWQKTGSNISPHIPIGGLGLLTDAIINSDRLITFG